MTTGGLLKRLVSPWTMLVNDIKVTVFCDSAEKQECTAPFRQEPDDRAMSCIIASRAGKVR